jgi:hypothetical protein
MGRIMVEELKKLDREEQELGRGKKGDPKKERIAGQHPELKRP